MSGIEAIDGLFARMKGLLFARPDGRTVMLIPCKDIHTFGMRYPIDVAFVDKEGVVTASYRDVGPRCRLRRRNAVAVLERLARKNDQWFVPGAYAGADVESAIRERNLQ